MRFILVIIMFVAMVASSLEGKAQSREEYGNGTPALAKLIKIYPQPASDQTEYLNVRVAPLKANKVKLSLHNIIGNQINVETEIVDEYELRMRIKELAAGYYFVTVKDEDSDFRCTYKVLRK